MDISFSYFLEAMLSNPVLGNNDHSDTGCDFR